VAKLLEQDRITVLVARDPEGCARASEALEKAIVINGDATDSNLFKDEGLDDAAVLMAATENSEFNMIACLLAKKRGVPRTLSIVDEPELRQLFEQIGVDIALSPRKMVVDFIIQHISGKQASATFTNLQGSGITAMEILVDGSLWMVGKEYHNIKMPRGSFIGSLIRNGKCVKPGMFDTVKPGDRIIVMVQPEAMRKVERLFSYRHGKIMHK
jgi:trk system potassium uptake protein TrkA